MVPISGARCGLNSSKIRPKRFSIFGASAFLALILSGSVEKRPIGPPPCILMS